MQNSARRLPFVNSMIAQNTRGKELFNFARLGKRRNDALAYIEHRVQPEETIPAQLRGTRDTQACSRSVARRLEESRTARRQCTVKIIGPFLTCARTRRADIYSNGAPENFTTERLPLSDRPPIKA